MSPCVCVCMRVALHNLSPCFGGCWPLLYSTLASCHDSSCNLKERDWRREGKNNESVKAETNKYKKQQRG